MTTCKITTQVRHEELLREMHTSLAEIKTDLRHIRESGAFFSEALREEISERTISDKCLHKRINKLYAGLLVSMAGVLCWLSTNILIRLFNNEPI